MLIFLAACGLNEEYSCENTEQVKFRNLKFSFPLTGDKVNQIASGNNITFMQGWIKTEPLINKHDKIYWYFNFNKNKNSLTDSAAYLKSCFIYGVTIRLNGEHGKTDEEVINELKQNYPGDYVYHKNVDTPYYILSKGCLKIIYRRILTNNYFGEYLSTPSVSFCYGLTEDQGDYYASSPGNISYKD